MELRHHGTISSTWLSVLASVLVVLFGEQKMQETRRVHVLLYTQETDKAVEIETLEVCSYLWRAHLHFEGRSKEDERKWNE